MKKLLKAELLNGNNNNISPSVENGSSGSGGNSSGSIGDGSTGKFPNSVFDAKFERASVFKMGNYSVPIKTLGTQSSSGGQPSVSTGSLEKKSMQMAAAALSQSLSNKKKKSKDQPGGKKSTKK